jgi:hypothetical protein
LRTAGISAASSRSTSLLLVFRDILPLPTNVWIFCEDKKPLIINNLYSIWIFCEDKTTHKKART